MLFLDTGYEIHSSEADQIKNTAITGIRHLIPEHLKKSRMIELIFKLIFDCGIGVVRIIFQALCNTPKGCYEKHGIPGEVSLMKGLDTISDEIKQCCTLVKVAAVTADCLRELAVFINVREFCELPLNLTFCLPCRVEEGDLLAQSYNIVAAVYLLYISGKLNENQNEMCHLFNHIKEELFVHVMRKAPI